MKLIIAYPKFTPEVAAIKSFAEWQRVDMEGTDCKKMLAKCTDGTDGRPVPSIFKEDGELIARGFYPFIDWMRTNGVTIDSSH